MSKSAEQIRQTVHDEYEDIDFVQIANLYGFGPNDPVNGFDVGGEAWGKLLREALKRLGPKPKPPTPKPPKPTPTPPKPKPKPKKKTNTGDCGKAEHRGLKRKVGLACKNKPFSCDNITCCDELKARRARANACKKARETISRRCFKGADPSHKAEAAKARRAAQKCQEKIDSLCN